MQRGSEYRKVRPPKKNRAFNVEANLNNNNDLSSREEGKVTCNQIMETLRQQPMKLAQKEELRWVSYQRQKK